MFTRTSRLLATAAVAAATGAMLSAPAQAQTTITCDYQFTAWSNGFMANVTIKNSGPAISGWTARWSLGSPTVLGSVWSAVMSQPDPVHLVASNASYNATIPAGGSVDFGWTALAQSTSAPTDITVNGTPC